MRHPYKNFLFKELRCIINYILSVPRVSNFLPVSWAGNATAKNGSHCLEREGG